jgi:hypothetical protein
MELTLKTQWVAKLKLDAQARTLYAQARTLYAQGYSLWVNAVLEICGNGEVYPGDLEITE